jgi:hypothetical protein
MRTPRRFGRLLPLVALVSVLAVVGWAPAAQAQTPPEHGSFSFSFDEIDTSLCPFPLQVSGQVSGDFTDFFDDAGNLTKSIIHIAATSTLSANGISLPGSEHSNFFLLFDESGNLLGETATGVTDKIHLPDGGVVGINVGRIVFDPTTGEVLFQAGKWQLFSGDTAALCAAFS